LAEKKLEEDRKVAPTQGKENRIILGNSTKPEKSPFSA